MFIFLDTDLKIDKPQADGRDRSQTRPRLLGLTMSDVGSALAAMLGGGYVNYFSLDGRSYKVIPQVQQRYRLNAGAGARTITSAPPSGALGAAVDGRAHHDQHGAAVAQSLPAAQRRDDPGRGGTRRRARRRAAVPAGPRGARRCRPATTVDYGGLSRQYVQESSGFLATFGFALGHHLPVARGAVRELPRSVHHPGLGADVDRRRAVLRQPRHRRREPQHLHRGRPGHADGADQQARHPDRGVRQRPAAGRPFASARRSRGCAGSGCGRS